MFNINNLVDTFSRLYASKKRTVVQEMKCDLDQAWKRRGERFEVFRPKYDNPQPSEWFITLYALFNPGLILGLRRPRVDDQMYSQAKEAASPLQYFTPIFRRRKVEPKQPEVHDEQPWVL